MATRFAEQWLQQTLAGVPCVGHLNPDTLLELGRRARWSSVEAGECFLSRGEWLGDVLFLTHGRVCVAREPEVGSCGPVQTLSAPAILGLEHAFADAPSSITVESVTAACIARLSRIALMDLMEREPSVAQKVAEHLARQAMAVETTAPTATVGARLRCALLAYAKATNTDERGRAQLPQPPAVGLWAALLDTTPGRLAKEVKRLERSGAIIVLPSGRTVIDPAKLQTAKRRVGLSSDPRAAEEAPD